MRRLLTLSLLALFVFATASQAVITALTPLSSILEGDDYIFVVTIEKVDPDKPSAVFKLDKKLKGEPPYERIAVNMTGNAEAKKQNDTKTILDRLDPSRKAVLFVSKRGKNHNAKIFVEGSWFSVHGSEDPADKVVRWSFQNGEPFLRRTFKGTSAELVKVLEDAIAKKAKPPEVDEKEKSGYGPPAVAKEKEEEEENRLGFRLGTDDDRRVRDPAHTPNPILNPDLNPLPAASLPSRGMALFAVIPSFILVGPLAIIAALFPGVFARMAVGMKRWRSFLVVASINSTLALLFWLLLTYWPNAIPAGWVFGIKAFTIYLAIISFVGLLWAGQRYRRMAAEDARITDPPTRTELLTLAGLTAFAGLCVLATTLFADFRTNFVLPMREFTFIGLALAVAAVYALYRTATAAVDVGDTTAKHLSLSGESVALGVLVLCGVFAILNMGRDSTGPVATGGTTGDAETIGPRFTDVKVFEVPGSNQVMSNITIDGDRLYFGAQRIRSSIEGQLFCLDRHTGAIQWKFEADDDLKPVFCTPTVSAGRVYCGEGMHESTNCRLFCLDAATGKPAWEKPYQVGSHTEGAPALAGGKLIFPAGDDGLFAVDAKTGARLWQFEGGKERGIHIDGAPVVSGNRVFAGSGLYSYVAVCLDADTGHQVWRTDLKLRSFGEPIVVGKQIYFGIGTGNMGSDIFDYDEEGGKKEDQPAGAVVCLDAETGKEVWRYDLPRSVHTGLAGDAFSIYAACRDGFVYCFDRATGKLRWSRGAGGPSLTSGPAVATAAGMPIAVYAVSTDGNVVCLNPHTGAIVWEKRLPGFQWLPLDRNGVFGSPAVVTTLTATGSKRTIYIGAMTVDPFNPAKKTAAVFKFEDELGGE